jgi:hypothetical protein
VPWTARVLGTPGGKWSSYLWPRDRKSVTWLHCTRGIVWASWRLITCELSSLCQESPSPRPIFGQRVLGQIRRTTNHEKRATGFSLLYTQSSILRNTETASTHQSVSYLNAFPRCDPSMPGRPCCRFQGGSPKIIAFPGSEPF